MWISRNGNSVLPRSDWKGHVTVAKGGRRAVRADDGATWRRRSRQHRHLRGRRVLLSDGRARRLTQKVIQVLMRRSAAAGERQSRGTHPPPHVLFAPGDAKSARESHSGTGGTPGPGHDAAVHALSPAALDSAIRLLEWEEESRGEIVEAAGNRP